MHGMKRPIDLLQYKAQAFFSLAVFVLACLLATFLIEQERDRLFLDLRNQTLMQAASIRAQLESGLSSDIYLANGLLGYISASTSPRLAPGPTQSALAAIYRYGHHIRNVGLAPDNIITYVYPLQGNEKALGLNYQDNREQWPAVRQAILSHDTVLAGPIRLKQGGTGLISRTPVYLSDGRYWGMISIVLDSDRFFRDIANMPKAQPVRWALRNTSSNVMIYGDAGQFDRAAIRLPIRVPGTIWEMAVAPAQGWHAHNPRLVVWRVVAYGIAALLAVLLYLLLTARLRIRMNDLQDPLTGLPNRRLFDDRLGQAVQLHKRQGNGFALLGLDVDAFKRLNATYGQRVGNLVLREIAQRLSSLIRHGDTLARVGGDKFMLILNGVDNEAVALQLADKIQTAIAAPIDIGSVSLKIGMSVGIGFYPQDGNNADALASSVDVTLYTDKQQGNGIVALVRQSRFAYSAQRTDSPLNSPAN